MTTIAIIVGFIAALIFASCLRRSKLLFLVIFATLLAGCSVPARVMQDLMLIEQEEQKLYDFNTKLIKSLNIYSAEELSKKIELLTISRIAHHRVKTAIRLLAEYLESTEYLSKEDLSIGDDIIGLIQRLKAELHE